MVYINCSHPRESLKVKAKKEKSHDLLVRYVTPRVYCNSCAAYLPSRLDPARRVIAFWLAHDGTESSALVKGWN